MQLQVVLRQNALQVRKFYEKLVTQVQSLETMKKLQEINVIVQLLTDKLHETRAELVVNNSNCQE